MPWYEFVRILLYISWFVMIGLVVKLLIRRSRWRHPLRGNGPMLWALLLLIASVELSRARNIDAGNATPPPYIPSLVFTVAATVLILVWLWQQMELIPRWLREHLLHRRERADRPKPVATPSSADYTLEEDTHHGAKPR